MSAPLTTTPHTDGYRMPAEWEPHRGTWLIWPERSDNWRNGAKPAQAAFARVVESIAEFEPVSVCVSAGQYVNARERLSDAVRLVEMSSNDSWIRDCGPTFVVNDAGRGAWRRLEVQRVGWPRDGPLLPVGRRRPRGPEGARPRARPALLAGISCSRAARSTSTAREPS